MIHWNGKLPASQGGTQTPSTGLASSFLQGRCRKAMLGVWAELSVIRSTISPVWLDSHWDGWNAPNAVAFHQSESVIPPVTVRLWVTDNGPLPSFQGWSTPLSFRRSMEWSPWLCAHSGSLVVSSSTTPLQIFPAWPEPQWVCPWWFPSMTRIASFFTLSSLRRSRCLCHWQVWGRLLSRRSSSVTRSTVHTLVQ